MTTRAVLLFFLCGLVGCDDTQPAYNGVDVDAAVAPPADGPSDDRATARSDVGTDAPDGPPADIAIDAPAPDLAVFDAAVDACTPDLNLPDGSPPVAEWLFTTTGPGVAIGRAIVLDSAGYVYMAGGVCGTVDIGSQTITASPQCNLLVAKLDPAGEVMWAATAPSSDSSQAYGIALDGAGSTYITGAFTGTATFGSASTLVAVGPYYRDVFVAKLDPSGSFAWANSGGGNWWDHGWDIAYSPSGHVYVTGHFLSSPSARFGPLSVTKNGSEWGTFVVKLDATSGDYLWATGEYGDQHDGGWGIVVDSRENVYITGDFHSHATFGTRTIQGAGYRDIYVAKLDADGNALWGIGSSGDPGKQNRAGKIALDSGDNPYITGRISGATQFGSQSLALRGEADLIVAKIDSAGSVRWAQSYGAALHQATGSDIALDNVGNIYVAGDFISQLDCGNQTLSSQGLTDIGLIKLAPDGSCAWAISAGGAGWDGAEGLAVDKVSGDIFSVGDFSGTAIFPTGTVTGSGESAFAWKVQTGAP